MFFATAVCAANRQPASQGTVADSDVASPIARKYLRLHLCSGVGPIRFAALLHHLGGIDGALGASIVRLAGVEGIGPKTAESIARSRDGANVERECALAAERGVRIICPEDDDYPPGLRRIPDPPACLYVLGGWEPADAVALAVVGSRHCTRYGVEQAERFAALLANVGLTIVSGMARGIDTAAHEGALAAGGRTLAVLGCGLCHLYPPESTLLAERIRGRGALLSELPMTVAPDAKNFPPRNRIIAGMSLGVLVVEAARRSGALITARLATEYNREVFAVPGRVDQPQAEGCNDLIRGGAAKLVAGLNDVLDELGEVGKVIRPAETAAESAASDDAAADSLLPAAGQPESRPGGKLDETELRILEALGVETLPMEAICELSGVPPGRTAAALTQLQLKGAVRRVGGDQFTRAPRA